jgi:hypothetical protein
VLLLVIFYYFRLVAVTDVLSVPSSGEQTTCNTPSRYTIQATGCIHMVAFACSFQVCARSAGGSHVAQLDHVSFGARWCAYTLCVCRQRYIMTSREVKRWDATSRSPVYASLSTTLKVCTSIRYVHSVCPWMGTARAVCICFARRLAHQLGLHLPLSWMHKAQRACSCSSTKYSDAMSMHPPP